MADASHDSETPAHGQQVISATAFIHHEFGGVEKVFLAKRAATKKFLPCLYELLGGHIDFGEDIVAGLKREVMEELKKEIIVGDPFAVFTYINDVKGSHSIEVTFFAQFVDAPERIELNPEDHSDCGWFSEDEISTLARRDEDDPETKAIQRGFALLRGERLRVS